MNRFELDESKSRSNWKKHGMDFFEAQRIWSDLNYLEIPARTMDEARSIVIGTVDGKHWSAVVTYRQQQIRIISVRRSRKEDIAIYESEEI